MLEFIRERASDRKMRLFAVACCRRVEAWTKYADKICGTTEFADSSSEPFNRGDDYRNAIHIAERFADGEATPGELNAACGAADNNLLSEGWICDCDPFVSVALTDIAEVALTARRIQDTCIDLDPPRTTRDRIRRKCKRVRSESLKPTCCETSSATCSAPLPSPLLGVLTPRCHWRSRCTILTISP